MKVVFIRDFSPRKEGEVVEFKTRDEIRTAEYYLANGIAKLCDCSKGKEGCPDCEKKKQISQKTLNGFKVVDLMEIAETLEIEVPAGTKKAGLIDLIEQVQKAK
jgi:hypothetical protein